MRALPALRALPVAAALRGVVASLILLAAAGCVEQTPLETVPYNAPGAPAQPAGFIAIGSSTPQPGATPTPYFGNYWGTASLDGAPVPVGSVVEAVNPRGDLVGWFKVNTAGYFGYMRVFGEDATASPPIPGMRAGEEITFKVNGKPAGTKPSPFLWQNAPEPIQVDLAAAP